MCTLSMQHFFTSARPWLSAVVLGLAAVPAFADSSTSSASSAASQSIGSSSTSVEKSSNSSSAKDKVAQGPYTVVDMVAVAQQPDMLRLRLQAVATTPGTSPAGDIVLLLPRQAAERGQVAVGQVIHAEHRPYGIAFATAGTTGHAATPFFLVLDDAWFGELESRPLGV
jgi:3-oxoacyl-[acyl-carrier-protein] synthase III